MNFFVGSISDPQLVIDALSGITKVRIVSSPSILVRENETATIKVGDQVPIQTQTLTTDGGNNVNSFEYRDTGVILKVKPRVNANGMVTINLGQELSAIRTTEGLSAGNNPTFTQHSINSKVSVSDQQTVLLGGLISGRENQNRETVPGADKVPVFDALPADDCGGTASACRASGADPGESPSNSKTTPSSAAMEARKQPAVHGVPRKVKASSLSDTAWSSDA